LKGSPIREFILVLLAGCLLALPLFYLTRPSRRAPPAGARPAAASDEIPAWFSLRLSHTPERFTLRQGGQVLAQGGGLLRVEDDLVLQHDGGHVAVQLTLQWPDDVPSAYVELSLEPVEMPEQRLGFWAAGTVTRTLEFSWTPPSP